jgi:aspartokinase-like uncharacterized kinase
MRQIASLAAGQRLIVLPGGSVFADLVRTEWARLRLSEECAHRMALLAMDQYGLALCHHCPGAEPVTDMRAARRVAAAGRVPILLASLLLRNDRHLERTFRVTSDSIAAYLAHRLGAARLVLLKSAANSFGLVPHRAAAMELARRGLVDPVFPDWVPGLDEVWIVSGSDRRALQGFRPRRAARPEMR